MIEERNVQESRLARTAGDLEEEMRKLVERHGLSYGRAAEIMSRLENGAAHPGAGGKTDPPGRNGAGDFARRFAR